MIFINLENSYDGLFREVLWNAMGRKEFGFAYIPVIEKCIIKRKHVSGLLRRY